MIAYRCDVCKELCDDRKTATVDGREYDLCAKCYQRTVGKLKDGRLVVSTWTVTPPIYYYYPIYVPQPQPTPAYWPLYGEPQPQINWTYTNTAAAVSNNQYLLPENASGAQC